MRTAIVLFSLLGLFGSEARALYNPGFNQPGGGYGSDLGNSGNGKFPRGSEYGFGYSSASGTSAVTSSESGEYGDVFASNAKSAAAVRSGGAGTPGADGCRSGRKRKNGKSNKGLPKLNNMEETFDETKSVLQNTKIKNNKSNGRRYKDKWSMTNNDEYDGLSFDEKSSVGKRRNNRKGKKNWDDVRRDSETWSSGNNWKYNNDQEQESSSWSKKVGQGRKFVGDSSRTGAGASAWSMENNKGYDTNGGNGIVSSGADSSAWSMENNKGYHTNGGNGGIFSGAYSSAWSKGNNREYGNDQKLGDSSWSVSFGQGGTFGKANSRANSVSEAESRSKAGGKSKWMRFSRGDNNEKKEIEKYKMFQMMKKAWKERYANQDAKAKNIGSKSYSEAASIASSQNEDGSSSASSTSAASGNGDAAFSAAAASSVNRYDNGEQSDNSSILDEMNKMKGHYYKKMRNMNKDLKDKRGALNRKSQVKFNNANMGGELMDKAKNINTLKKRIPKKDGGGISLAASAASASSVGNGSMSAAAASATSENGGKVASSSGKGSS